MGKDKKTPIFRQVHDIQSHIDLTLMDRLRLVFGARLALHLSIATQWQQEIAVNPQIVIRKLGRKGWFTPKGQKRLEPLQEPPPDE